MLTLIFLAAETLHTIIRYPERAGVSDAIYDTTPSVGLA